jgi:hypothetical protein
MQVGKGSWGFQIGAQSIDLVLLVMNERGTQKMLRNKVTLGAEASVAAGPVGRDARAATDAQMKAEILSYSRAPGIVCRHQSLRRHRQVQRRRQRRSLRPRYRAARRSPRHERQRTRTLSRSWRRSSAHRRSSPIRIAQRAQSVQTVSRRDTGTTVAEQGGNLMRVFMKAACCAALAMLVAAPVGAQGTTLEQENLSHLQRACAGAGRDVARQAPTHSSSPI